jgi:hypothetical protein
MCNTHDVEILFLISKEMGSNYQFYFGQIFSTWQKQMQSGSDKGNL